MTEAQRITRHCARVLAVSAQGRVLLLRGHDPARPEFAIWHAPGGGLEIGETAEQAAVREFAEEIGYDITLGPHVWNRLSRFSYDGVPYEQYEKYFLALVDEEFDPSFVNMADYEREFVTGFAWLDVAALLETQSRDLLAPPDLPARLEDIILRGAPTVPVDVGGEVLP